MVCSDGGSRFRDEDNLKRILMARGLNLDNAYKMWEVSSPCLFIVSTSDDLARWLSLR